MILINKSSRPLKWAKFFYELLTGENIKDHIISARGKMGISQQNWYLMAEGKMKIPMNVAIQVSKLCYGAISVEDIYGEKSEKNSLYQYTCAWIGLYAVDDVLNKEVREVLSSKNDRNNKVLRVLKDAGQAIGPTEIARRINEDWCMFQGTPQSAVIFPVLKKIGAVNTGNGWILAEGYSDEQ